MENINSPHNQASSRTIASEVDPRRKILSIFSHDAGRSNLVHRQCRFHYRPIYEIVIVDPDNSSPDEFGRVLASPNAVISSHSRDEPHFWRASPHATRDVEISC